MAPTVSIEDLWEATLLDNAALTEEDIALGITSKVGYSELVVSDRNQRVTQLAGSCGLWSGVFGSDLASSTVAHLPVALRLSATFDTKVDNYDLKSVSQKDVTCGNVARIERILDALMIEQPVTVTSSTPNVTTTIECEGNQWVVKYCSASASTSASASASADRKSVV